MAFLSTPRTNLIDSLVGVCRLAEIMGARVGEMHGFRKPSPVHNKASFHYGKDKRGYGFAADLNENLPGVNPPSERALLIRVLHIARSLGLATTFALNGTVGTANAHKGHLHIDIGQWSNIGKGLIRASVVKYTGTERFIVTPTVGLRGRRLASTISPVRYKRGKGHQLTILQFKVAGKYVWGKASDGAWYALVSIDGKDQFVKAGKK